MFFLLHQGHHLLLLLIYAGPGISPALVPVAEQAHYAPPPLKPGIAVVNTFVNYSN